MGADLHERGSRCDLSEPCGAVDLYWIPLGTGAQVVRASGRVFEWVSALVQRRPPRDLYHSALAVVVPQGRYVIEMTPIADLNGEERGVVAEGPVGTRWAGRIRLFRYEIRRWRKGVIPDAAQAISSPVRVTDDLGRARRILDLVPSVPTPVWAETSSPPATCGTRTRSLHGCSHEEASLPANFSRRLGGAPLGGRQVLSLPPVLTNPRQLVGQQKHGAPCQ